MLEKKVAKKAKVRGLPPITTIEDRSCAQTIDLEDSDDDDDVFTKPAAKAKASAAKPKAKPKKADPLSDLDEDEESDAAPRPKRTARAAAVKPVTYILSDDNDDSMAIDDAGEADETAFMEDDDSDDD